MDASGFEADPARVFPLVSDQWCCHIQFAGPAAQQLRVSHQHSDGHVSTIQILCRKLFFLCMWHLSTGWAAVPVI